MKTGIELIAAERQEQIEKHGITLDIDIRTNTLNQLATGAGVLCVTDLDSRPPEVIRQNCPIGWHMPHWLKMANKPKKERLIIAGALIAAEIDRLQALEP